MNATNRADLVIGKTNSASSVNAGGSTSYTVTVTNNGPSEVTGAVVTDPAPTGLTIGAWSCAVTTAGSGGSVTTACGTASGSGALNTTANLKVGGVVTYTIAATVTAGSGTVTNTASVAPPSGTSNPGTGCVTGGGITRSFSSGTCSSSDADTVNAVADLVIGKTNSASSVNAGGGTSYTVTVTNNGPSEVTGAVVTDPAPTGLTIGAWSLRGDHRRLGRFGNHGVRHSERFGCAEHHGQPESGWRRDLHDRGHGDGRQRDRDQHGERRAPVGHEQPRDGLRYRGRHYAQLQ